VIVCFTIFSVEPSPYVWDKLIVPPPYRRRIPHDLHCERSSFLESLLGTSGSANVSFAKYTSLRFLANRSMGGESASTWGFMETVEYADAFLSLFYAAFLGVLSFPIRSFYLPSLGFRIVVSTRWLYLLICDSLV